VAEPLVAGFAGTLDGTPVALGGVRFFACGGIADFFFATITIFFLIGYF
jgi:hypothetical protein